MQIVQNKNYVVIYGEYHTSPRIVRINSRHFEPAFPKFFGDSIVFKDVLKVEAELVHVNLSKPQTIEIIYQGCAEGKYCYPKILKSL